MAETEGNVPPSQTPIKARTTMTRMRFTYTFFPFAASQKRYGILLP